MLRISPGVTIPLSEVQFTAVRSQGAGGQNVNKVSTAIHLFFDIGRSSLPGFVKERLLRSRDRRITADGLLVIKAQRHRTQEQNRNDALLRLSELVGKAAIQVKKRRPTKPTGSSRTRRLDQKGRRSRIKSLRGPAGEG